MSEPLLEATGVAKTYGAVAALRNASLSVRPGEVHALMGANGAGKSTLVKILTGAIQPNSGRILIRGKEHHVRSPAEARRGQAEEVTRRLRQPRRVRPHPDYSPPSRSSRRGRSPTR